METHGTVIAYLCYEIEDQFKRIGALIYFRSHKDDSPPEAQVRLDMIPSKAWANGIKYFVGNFIPSEKIPEPVFIDGDLLASTEERGKPVCCGHIHLRQNAASKKNGEYQDHATQYYMELYGIPVTQWLRVHDSDREKKSIYLKVRTE